MVVPAPEHGTVRFWRVSDGALLRLFDRETGVYVSSLAVSRTAMLFAYTRRLDGVVTVARRPF